MEAVQCLPPSNLSVSTPKHCLLAEREQPGTDGKVDGQMDGQTVGLTDGQSSKAEAQVGTPAPLCTPSPHLESGGLELCFEKCREQLWVDSMLVVPGRDHRTLNGHTP